MNRITSGAAALALLCSAAAVPAQPAGPAMFPGHPHTLDVSAVNAFLELANELDDRDPLPLHVRAVKIETHHILISGFVHCREIVMGRFDIAQLPV